MPYPSSANLPLNLLDSAARTSNTSSGVQANPEHRGVILLLDVTAASGTGGLIPQIRFHDPITAASKIVWGIPQPILATGTYVYVHYPGVSLSHSNAVQYVVPLPLAAFWSVIVTHGDGSSYTYSLSAYLIV